MEDEAYGTLSGLFWMSAGIWCLESMAVRGMTCWPGGRPSGFGRVRDCGVTDPKAQIGAWRLRAPTHPARSRRAKLPSRRQATSTPNFHFLGLCMRAQIQAGLHCAFPGLRLTEVIGDGQQQQGRAPGQVPLSHRVCLRAAEP